MLFLFEGFFSCRVLGFRPVQFQQKKKRWSKSCTTICRNCAITSNQIKGFVFIVANSYTLPPTHGITKIALRILCGDVELVGFLVSSIRKLHPVAISYQVTAAITATDSKVVKLVSIPKGCASMCVGGFSTTHWYLVTPRRSRPPHPTKPKRVN